MSGGILWKVDESRDLGEAIGNSGIKDVITALAPKSVLENYITITTSFVIYLPTLS